MTVQCVGHGQVGASLVSSLSIGNNDIGKMSDKIEDAKLGSKMIYDTLWRKLLS